MLLPRHECGMLLQCKVEITFVPTGCMGLHPKYDAESRNSLIFAAQTPFKSDFSLSLTYASLAPQDVRHRDREPPQEVRDRLEVSVPRRHDVHLNRLHVGHRPTGVVLGRNSVMSRDIIAGISTFESQAVILVLSDFVTTIGQGSNGLKI